MDTQENIQTFMESLDPGNTDLLKEMEREALADGIPIIRTQTQSLIRFLMEARKPAAILEAGTATGFSASLMYTFAPENARITTIEKDPERIQKARENFAKIGAGERIRLLSGDAAQILKELEGPYDFIFMDAAKGQYIRFLPDVLRLLSPSGILLSDNIFEGGEVLRSRFAVPRRDRTIHRRMREYLEAITRDERLVTVLLEEGDGAALSVRKTE